MDPSIYRALKADRCANGFQKSRLLVVDGAPHTGGSFSLGGETFTIPANDGDRPNTVHGGAKGARFRVFDAVELSSSSVQMSLTFVDGEDAAPGFTGFPGTVSLEVVYTLTEQNALSVRYSAASLDKATVVNFTSHPFFNLSNTPGSPVADHVLTINSEQFLEIDPLLIPTGALRSVDGTPMDFRSGKPVGADIGDVSYDMLARIDPMKGGYDHTFAVALQRRNCLRFFHALDWYTFSASAGARSGRLLGAAGGAGPAGG